MLYFNAGIPARAVLRIIWQMSSISRSRSGFLPSMMFGISNREISFELMGSGTMSRVTPNDSTRSRSRERPSTDHLSSRRSDGRRLQMLLTPKPAIARRMASESPCCVPTFMRAGFAGCVAGLKACATGDNAVAPRNSRLLDVKGSSQSNVLRRSADHDIVRARFNRPFHVAVEQQQVVAADREPDALLLARLQRDPIESAQHLVVVDDARHARREVELDDLVAGAGAGVLHVERDRRRRHRQVRV